MRDGYVRLCTMTLFAIGLASVASAGIGDDLVAHYAFEGDVTDATGNGNDGTAFGAPGFVPGTSGQALSLDGVDDHVRLPGNLMQDDFSVAFRIRTVANAPFASFWWQGLGVVDGEVCGSPPGGDTGIALIDGGLVVFEALKSTVSVNDGSFHAVAVTRSGTSIEIFVDGALDVTGSLSIGGPITGMPWIGVGNNACDVGFNRLWLAADIDELRFYDRVLTPTEIGQLAGVIPVPTSSPVSVVVVVVALAALAMFALKARESR